MERLKALCGLFCEGRHSGAVDPADRGNPPGEDRQMRNTAMLYGFDTHFTRRLRQSLHGCMKMAGNRS